MARLFVLYIFVPTPGPPVDPYLEIDSSREGPGEAWTWLLYVHGGSKSGANRAVPPTGMKLF